MSEHMNDVAGDLSQDHGEPDGEKKSRFEVDVLAVSPVTHDVRAFRTTRPDGFTFTPGQATDLTLLRDGWRDEERPFTFTSLPDDPELEFTIKLYPSHDGVTEQLGTVEEGATFEIGAPWGTIEYKGPGVFIAGGAGITPFLSILRAQAQAGSLDGHRLVFANAHERDIICRDELEGYAGLDVTHVLSDENVGGMQHGRIDKNWLAAHVTDFDQAFYVCGPPAMVEDITSALKELGADPEGINFEE
ncbi:MAG: FAD-binding oxidoreductase [Pseudomonadota bacterium]